MRLLTIVLFISSLLLISCSERDEPRFENELDLKMNKIAEDYVKLVLKVGLAEPAFVDAYYGPEEWKPGEEYKIDSSFYSNLNNNADELLNDLDALSEYKADSLQTLRYRYLYKQLLAVKTKITMLRGAEFTFEEEAKSLYDVTPPELDDSFFLVTIEKLDSLLPGNGSTSERLKDFTEQFKIPEEKLDVVFAAAIDECRKRTLEHVSLPDNENFKVEYVKDKPWGAYNWFKGNGFSVIQVNSGVSIYIDRAVELAAHEGYPGHHVYNALLEKNLVKDLGWMEYSVYALFSPQSLIAEGTAEYGIRVVFPGDSRIKFEKEVLFPLAGLDSSQADLYYQVLDLQKDLSYSVTKAARHYINKEWTKEETIDWLKTYGLKSEDRANRHLDFIDTYGAYVINYNFGEDLVEDYIERNGGTKDNTDKRWDLFKHLISTPQTPSGLK